jgi:hypothetical protein
MSEHTPGPWTIDAPLPSDRRWLIRGVGRSAALATVLTSEADARLIAAAPEMYEALQAVWSGRGDVYTSGALDEVKAVFRKIEGRS